jgi:hypothetical protein
MPSHLHERSLQYASAAVLLLLSAQGCVDPQGRYDAFIERTADMRGQDAAMGATAERFDFSGQYLLGLSTTLAVGVPILFDCNVTVAADLETLDLSIQPLTTDADGTPRVPTGESVTAAGVPYAEDGSFTADLGEVTVPGNANPISGADIVASVVITASAFPMTAELPTYFCGQVMGMVTVPLAVALAGSTIGAVQATSFTDAEPLLSCPASAGP